MMLLFLKESDKHIFYEMTKVLNSLPHAFCSKLNVLCNYRFVIITGMNMEIMGVYCGDNSVQRNTEPVTNTKHQVLTPPFHS